MPLVPRSAFIGGEAGSYLFTAGEGLVPVSVLEATRHYYENKVDPVNGRHRHMQVDHEVRSGLASLMGASAGDIALLGNSSQGIAAIYALINWRPGDNLVLVTNDLEFPSVVLPAVKLVRDVGVETRVVGHENWIVTPAMIEQAIDERTRLVFVSHVSYRTGYRIDLQALGEVVHRHGALLAVDATQSLGVIPVAAEACDFLVATSCKWLLSPHGIGVFYWNRARLPGAVPRDIGWYSVVDDLQFPYELKPDAGRFELGGPSWPSIYAMAEGLKVLLAAGVERIEEHVVGLGGVLLDRLVKFERDILTPRDPQLRAGIVSWTDPDNARTAAALAQQGVFVTGSSGRIRVGFHLYNDESDIDQLVEALRTVA